MNISKHFSNQISKVNTKFCSKNLNLKNIKKYLHYFASKIMKMHKTLVLFYVIPLFSLF